MDILFVRHGETDWNTKGWIQGQTDTPLNRRGREQAEELAEKLLRRRVQPVSLYTSPQKRAAETADLVGLRLGLTPVALEGLREISFGIWEGNTWSEIQTRWPEDFERYRADRFHVPSPEGESYDQLMRRVLPALRQIVAESGPEDSALVVTHSAVIKSVLCCIHKVSFAEIIRRFPVRNADVIAVPAEQILALREDTCCTVL